MRRIRVLISGRVQGVFFRANTREKAQELNLTGWVKNTPDGRVEALFEGEERQVAEMLTWCHQGPPSARVLGLEIFEDSYVGEFADFKIAY